MFETKVVEIGELVEDFKDEGVLVLFGPSAPPELKDISVIHEFPYEPNNVLKTGMTIELGGIEYKVYDVGSEANKNFEELGHLSIYFSEDGSMEILPGAIGVMPDEFPSVSIGEVVRFKTE